MWSWAYSHVVALFASLYVWEMVHEGFMIHTSLAFHHLIIVIAAHIAIGYYPSRDWITMQHLHGITHSGFAQIFAAGLEQPTSAPPHHHHPFPPPVARGGPSHTAQRVDLLAEPIRCAGSSRC